MPRYFASVTFITPTIFTCLANDFSPHSPACWARGVGALAAPGLRSAAERQVHFAGGVHRPNPTLTDWVLNVAIRQQRLWFERGYDVVISVNLSARSLCDSQLANRFRSALLCRLRGARAGRSPGRAGRAGAPLSGGAITLDETVPAVLGLSRMLAAPL
jgi:hypothetical protein